ncbi:hypothetical protein BGZ61DRAFT_347053 [Ilyonectria robusta]|uniref:uncharacterized protein n=1 Tax=Ilyonectria robusta TaxID=1079257 RepID=UPI001E8CB018|nr:uncharacterized protein BGZ61DRAFT_347053 [Ilyonectria robusta]KAH8721602.1 hypothetical protein BGZ61DRAFT_347053 [Ilyonectria robusta]
MRLTLATLVAGLFSSVAFSSPTSHPGASKVKTRQLIQVPNVWIENFAVRSNGELLLNTFNDGRLYSFNPSKSPPTARELLKLEGVNALTGITEVGKDVFVIAGANIDQATVSFEEGSQKVALVDFRKSNYGSPSVRVILEDQDTTFLNGLTTLPRHKHIILGAASKTGEVWRIDTRTGATKLAFKDELLGTVPSGPFPLGINGLKIFKNYLYFTNTARQSFGRVKIDEFGNKKGDVQVIAQAPAGSAISPDDFSLDKFGNAFVTFHPNLLFKITPDGKQTVLVNGTLAGPTSAAFSKDGRSLYVVTGGQGVEEITGGQVVKVSL